ncbi:hypothetical protein CR513_52891, partial [Mucuna pruriens]
MVFKLLRISEGEATLASGRGGLANNHGCFRTISLRDTTVPSPGGLHRLCSYRSIPGQKIKEKIQSWQSWPTPTTPSTIIVRGKREV